MPALAAPLPDAVIRLVPYRQAMAMLVVGNLRAFFRGEPLLTPAG